MKQTAVEWYEIEINSLIEKYEAKEISEIEFITMKHNLFYKAEEMEKQQIIRAYTYAEYSIYINSGEDYYNETFKNK
jgi:hypothetical protein